ncbi:MAG: C25 family cysteine peptidase [candidate division WOR-3 bacterium]
MKKFLFLFVCIVSIIIFSEQIIVDINDENEFNEIIKEFNSQYFYHIKESYPVIPSYKIFVQFENDIFIDSSYFLVESIDTLKDFTLIAGEDPLPKIFSPSQRSSLKMIKGVFPEETYRIFKSKANDKIFVSGYVNNFYYENGKIFKRKGKLVIVYKKLEFQKIDTKSKNEFLIITADSLKSYWTGYVDLKKDYTVNIVGVSEIFSLYPAKTKSQAIREYIKTLYETGNLAGVLLGGDVDVIPPFYVQLNITPQLSPEDQTIPTDKFYSCLDGYPDFVNDTLFDNGDSIDLVPDILLGRVPVKKGADIANFIQKVIKFENLINDTILFAASFLDPNTDGSQNIENMIKNIPVKNPTIKLYESSNNLSSFSFIENINKSPFLISHDGHGNYSVIQTGIDYTTKSNFDTLKNTNPVLMYSLSCLSAAYDYDCVAEHFILSPNGGGYYIGNSRYGWYTPYFAGFGTGDILNYTFFKNILNNFNNPSLSLNETFLKFIDEIRLKNDWRWQFYTLNYFGDPLLNLKTNKNKSTLQIVKPVYKNGYLNFSVQTKDSCYVSIDGKTFSLDTFVYKEKNILSIKPDNSDSIFLYIKNSDEAVFDTTIVLNDFYSKSIFLKDYSFQKNDDTILLNLYLTGDSSGVFYVKTVYNSDTLNFIDDDTSLNFLGDTVITFKFIAKQNLKNSSMIGVMLENDTLYIEYGRNISENLKVKFTPEKQHYVSGEIVKYNIYVTSFTGETLGLSFKGKNFQILKGKNVFSDSFILLNNQQIETLRLDFTSALETKVLTYKLNINDNSSYESFENSPSIRVDSSTAFFHITNRRSNQGLYSIFSGYKSVETYPANYITTFYTDSFVFDSNYLFGFSAFVDIEPGMDYLVVKLVSDSFEIPVITLSHRTDYFKNYIFNASNFQNLHNKKSILQFSFYSENDPVQYKGVYIDDVTFPGERINFSGDRFIKTPVNRDLSISYSMGSLFIDGDFEKINLKVYDITGKIVFKKEVKKGVRSLKFEKPSGIYFIRVENRDKVLTKKIFLIK